MKPLECPDDILSVCRVKTQLLGIVQGVPNEMTIMIGLYFDENFLGFILCLSCSTASEVTVNHPLM
jgi:hypothetical protein